MAGERSCDAFDASVEFAKGQGPAVTSKSGSAGIESQCPAEGMNVDHLLFSFSALRVTPEGNRLIRSSGWPSVYGFFRFRAGREQFQQHGVALPFEFCDRTAVSLLQYAVDNG